MEKRNKFKLKGKKKTPRFEDIHFKGVSPQLYTLRDEVDQHQEEKENQETQRSSHQFFEKLSKIPAECLQKSRKLNLPQSNKKELPENPQKKEKHSARFILEGTDNLNVPEAIAEKLRSVRQKFFKRASNFRMNKKMKEEFFGLPQSVCKTPQPVRLVITQHPYDGNIVERVGAGAVGYKNKQRRKAAMFKRL